MVDADGGGARADVDHRNGLFDAAVRNLVKQQLKGVFGGVGLHVDNLGIQAAALDGRAAHVDRFGAAGCQQDVHRVRVVIRRPEHLEIQADFFQRVGDVLIGFQLDLAVHFVVRQAVRHRHDLGDHG